MQKLPIKTVFKISILLLLVAVIAFNIWKIYLYNQQGQAEAEIQKQEALIDRGDDDTDQDGLADWEEYLYGTDPEIADTDGDGVSDGQEVSLGRDPSVPGSGDAEEVRVVSENLVSAEPRYEGGLSLNETLATLPAIEFPKEDPQKKQVIRAYLNNLGSAVMITQSGQDTDAVETIRAFADGRQREEAQELFDKYHALVSQSQVQVEGISNIPIEFSYVHTNVQQSQQNLVDALDALRQSGGSNNIDQLQVYAQAVLDWRNAIALVAGRVDQSGLEFAPTEPGTYFQFSI
tara:strand:- start:285 stop:1154 length:870 start_codon:yes stop_codon:yes gene_type:complete